MIERIVAPSESKRRFLRRRAEAQARVDQRGGIHPVPNANVLPVGFSFDEEPAPQAPVPQIAPDSPSNLSNNVSEAPPATPLTATTSSVGRQAARAGVDLPGSYIFITGEDGQGGRRTISKEMVSPPTGDAGSVYRDMDAYQTRRIYDEVMAGEDGGKISVRRDGRLMEAAVPSRYRRPATDDDVTRAQRMARGLPAEPGPGMVAGPTGEPMTVAEATDAIRQQSYQAAETARDLPLKFEKQQMEQAEDLVGQASLEALGAYNAAGPAGGTALRGIRGEQDIWDRLHRGEISQTDARILIDDFRSSDASMTDADLMQPIIADADRMARTISGMPTIEGREARKQYDQWSKDVLASTPDHMKNRVAQELEFRRPLLESLKEKRRQPNPLAIPQDVLDAIELAPPEKRAGLLLQAQREQNTIYRDKAKQEFDWALEEFRQGNMNARQLEEKRRMYGMAESKAARAEVEAMRRLRAEAEKARIEEVRSIREEWADASKNMSEDVFPYATADGKRLDMNKVNARGEHVFQQIMSSANGVAEPTALIEDDGEMGEFVSQFGY